MEEWKLGYLAGFLDGEGSLGVNKHKAVGKNKTDQYALLIRVANTNLKSLTFIQEEFGGNLYKKKCV